MRLFVMSAMLLVVGCGPTKDPSPPPVKSWNSVEMSETQVILHGSGLPYQALEHYRDQGFRVVEMAGAGYSLIWFRLEKKP